VAPACPVGPEFHVNANPTSNAGATAIARNGSGNSVIVWSTGSATASDVFARCYNGTGIAQGSEFRVNSIVSVSQNNPAVGIDSSGRFVVAWSFNSQGGNNWDVLARRFNADGTPNGGEFQVNSYTINNQFRPAVAMNEAGDFVISWESWIQDGSGYGIYAKRYDAAANPQGGEFRVNTNVSSSQRFSSVAIDDDGDFVIAWDSYNQDGSSRGIYAQRYSNLGISQGIEFRVNTFTTGAQAFPDVDMDAIGNFVVVWESVNQDGSGLGIFANRYDAGGVPIGGEFRVNSSTSFNQRNPDVTMDIDGDFVVCWSNDSPSGSLGIFAQMYNNTGVPAGDEFRGNLSTTAAFAYPSVAIDSNGDFLIGWDGDNYIFGQRFASSGNPPQLADLQINNGSSQRSLVTSLSITFSENVTFPNGTGTAFQLSRTGPGGPIGNIVLNAVASANVVTLTFAPGGPVGIDPGGSLKDGRYQLTVYGNQVVGGCGLLDGDNDGTQGGNYVTSTNGPGAIFRLFGDSDGNGTVNSTDFAAFRTFFGTPAGPPSIFDFDNSGGTDANDFAEFRSRFGLTI